jgi:DNA-binding response OmpR family regulator
MNELILVVDDEAKIVKLARDYLEKNGFQVISAGDGITALAMARRQRPDLIVLDLLLPGMDGREVCRALRRDTEVPIIMLTALAEESDQVVGLELGADDYVTKPFSPRALVARVRALLRRSRGSIRTPPILRSGDLEIDRERHKVTLGEQCQYPHVNAPPIFTHTAPVIFSNDVPLSRRGCKESGSLVKVVYGRETPPPISGPCPGHDS